MFTPCLVSTDGLIGFGARGYVAVIILSFLLFLAFPRVFLGWGRGDVKYIGFCIGLGVFLEGRWLLGCFFRLLGCLSSRWLFYA